MKKLDISQAKSPDLRGSYAALIRAGELARDVAIQTNTAIIVMEDGKLVRVTAKELLEERKRKEKAK